MSPDVTGPLPSDVEIERLAMAPPEPSVPHPASDAKAATRATAAMLLSRIVIAALGWAGSVIIARTLSPEDWGSYSFVFALLGLTAIFTDLGVGRAVMARLISDDAEDVARTSSAFIALRVLLGLVGYVLAVLYVVVLQYPGEVIRATAVAGLVVVFATPGQALTVIFQSRHRLVLTAIAESLGQVLQLAITIAAALVAPWLLVFVLAPVANEIFALSAKIAGIARRRSGLRPSRVVEWSRWKPMLTDALPLAIGFALTIALQKIDVLLLSLLDSLDAVGIYSIGYKFSDIMDTLILAAVGPISTLLVAAWPHRPGELRQRCRTAAIAFGAAGGVAVAAFWPSAEGIIELLYGRRFVEGADAARFLVLGAAIMSLIVLGIFLLAATGFAKRYPWIAVSGLALNIVLNLVLIPRYSYTGAAIATVITFGMCAVALWTVVARTLPVTELLPGGSLLALTVLTAAVCVAGVWAADHVPWPVVSVVAALAVGAPGVALLKRVASPPGRHAKVLR
ncbi:flippase [Gordonia rubripertincta]|uniref:flippase n=1 Tax=Gordonia rubripertincta TaxID=36822 RepID=UPI0015F8C63E|nr:flippase [Gordonia rubripertincta]QMU20908.1 flippase [Gordonia rubripertincta]